MGIPIQTAPWSRKAYKSFWGRREQQNVRKEKKEEARVSRDHAGVESHWYFIWKERGGKGSRKGNHSSAKVNGKLPLTLTGEHSTQASWTNTLNWIYIPAAAVIQKKMILLFMRKKPKLNIIPFCSYLLNTNNMIHNTVENSLIRAGKLPTKLDSGNHSQQ